MLRGLADPVADGQAIFRAVLEAMSRPGRIVEVLAPLDVPPPLGPAATAVCLALIDLETRLWLDGAARTRETLEFVRFHCGVLVVDAPRRADFALVADAGAIPPLESFNQGTDEEPERSATVIVQVDSLAAAGGVELMGPGIADRARLCAGGLTPAFWSQVRENHARFPRGVDLVLAAGTRLAALPRTTRVEG